MSELTIQQKLKYIQQTLVVPKNEWNDHGKFKYRNIETIHENVKPLLEKLGLVLIESDEMVAVGDMVFLKATATISDESGATFTTTGYAKEAISQKGMNAAQITGSSSTYARKYALGGMFLLDNNEDPDTVSDPTRDWQQEINQAKSVKALMSIFQSMSEKEQKQYTDLLSEAKRALEEETADAPTS